MDMRVLGLKDLSIGEKGRVKGFNKQERSYRKRLLAMGLTPGTEFSIVRYAPLGDPIEINLRGFSLTLRKDEADILSIEKL
jgi:ferrous iron transport protein A